VLQREEHLYYLWQTDRQTDNKALHRLQIKVKLVSDCHHYMVKLTEYSRNQTVWVSGHVATDGRERADGIDRQSCSHPKILPQPMISSVYRARPLVTVLSQLNTRHALCFCFYNIHFNIIIPPNFFFFHTEMRYKMWQITVQWRNLSKEQIIISVAHRMSLVWSARATWDDRIFRTNRNEENCMKNWRGVNAEKTRL
jgi:hypothetical protein